MSSKPKPTVIPDTGLQPRGAGAAYIRVSSDQQDTARQFAAVHAFEQRHRVTIPKQHWFTDEGWTRDEADHRPAFQQLLRLAESGAVGWIVVDARDRFGTKDAYQLVHYLYRLRECGCKLYDAAGKEWTAADIGTIITAVVDGEKSKGEQTDKSHCVLWGKAAKARLGEWQGGPVRLGFDVVRFSRETDRELWRVVFEGVDRQAAETRLRQWEKKREADPGARRPPAPLRRLKVYPDGRTERFDGERNFPQSQPLTDVLRVAPSRDRAKIDAAVSVFRRYATESISFTALAHHLNSLGFRSSFGGPFMGHHIERMLEDPIYIEYYTWNRTHHGKFHRYKDGQTVQELRTTRSGSAGTTRRTGC